MDDFLEPLEIEAVRAERVLRLTWNDGHESAYDFEHLRWRCPCATCQGEGGMQGMLTLTQELSPEQTVLVDVKLVGRYAIALRWQDGHDTGIYSFEYLRAICPCDACVYRPH